MYFTTRVFVCSKQTFPKKKIFDRASVYRKKNSGQFVRPAKKLTIDRSFIFVKWHNFITRMVSLFRLISIPVWLNTQEILRIFHICIWKFPPMKTATKLPISTKLQNAIIAENVFNVFKMFSSLVNSCQMLTGKFASTGVWS